MKSIVELTRECEAFTLPQLIARRDELLAAIEFLGKKRRFRQRRQELQWEIENVVAPLITEKTPRRRAAQ